MKIRFDDIPEEGLVLTLSGEEDILSQALEIISTPEGVRIDPMVRGYIQLLHSGTEILFSARVTSSFRLRCSRCLADFDLPIEMDLNLLLRRTAGQLPTGEELAESEPSEVLIAGEEVDVGAIVAEEFLLDLPMKPLCNEECPGLCPRCGALRGSQQCQCPEEGRTDSRWTALAALKEKISP